ncbi:MAG TPA: tryptophan 7-halogenase [Micromonosporaceae bacterium]|nr:tryptophan 7-halogenase [Micromonosporaceae bacterium]
MSTARSSAVVIGAGIAGLTSARVLAERFERVTVLDRDLLPDAGVPRRGVPQGHHPHTLLLAGQRALEGLFPGLREELVGAGAVVFDTGGDLAYYRGGEPWPALPIGLETINVTRPRLEYAIRRRVAAMTSVTIRDGVAIAGLTGDDSRITGVTLDDGDVLPADLVVDCSGRGTRSDRWLGSLGFPTPHVAEVKIGVGYATRLARRTPGDLAEGAALLVLPVPPGERRSGLALPVEGDRWLISGGGWHGDYPAADDAALRRHLRSLPHGGIADLYDRAEPLDEVRTAAFPSSRRRYFERLRRLPAGYLAAGDAMCSFNPVYGQGMTCAALEATVLGQVLDDHPGASPEMARAYYRAAARILTTPWRFAVGADFRFPGTTGPKVRGTDALNGYSHRIWMAALTSTEVRRTLLAVQHLVSPPSALFAPAMVARVLREPRRARRAAGRP